MTIPMKVPAAEFKTHCLKLMDQVARTRRPIVITKRGKPVAKLMPPDEPASRRPLFGRMGGTVKKEGDLLAPLGLEWSAVTGEEDGLYKGPRQDRFIHGVADAPKRGPK